MGRRMKPSEIFQILLEHKYDENAVHLAMTKVRELQTLIFDKENNCQKKLFEKCEEVIRYMEKGAVAITANYAQISKKLTDEMNTGRVQQ
jgi:hypothetical protein